MGLSRKQATAAITGCTVLNDHSRGALKGFLSIGVSDAELLALPIEDHASHDEVVGFLEEYRFEK